MKKKVTYYHIKKFLVKSKTAVFLNDGLSSILELKDYSKAKKLCNLLNSKSGDSCKYELIEKESI